MTTASATTQKNMKGEKHSTSDHETPISSAKMENTLVQTKQAHITFPTLPLLATNQVLAYIAYVSLAGILAIGCHSRPMIHIRCAIESWPISGVNVALADSAGSERVRPPAASTSLERPPKGNDSTSAGWPPKAALTKMWRRPEAAPFQWLRSEQTQHSQPVSATTRAMA